jgi:HNH endonuclease
MEEIWRDYISGYIEVSNLGNLRTIDRLVNNGKGSFQHRKSQAIKATVNITGYRTVILCHNSTRKTMSLHRIVAETFLDNPGNLPCVNHIDGDKLNNRVDNLEWISHSDNQRHAYDTGLKRRDALAAISADDALCIYNSFKNSENTLIGLAGIFGVTKGCIQRICYGDTWKHVTGGVSLAKKPE